ncbi:hypothetical protein [Aurantiacibacter rhizosphaerae]|uniref:Uncharacterized protein n=1 Tax=Aurantiacibacter rhizosphaerae TaxID=2691582 RepID=A0A844XBS3_9SPHN|nr:hypothetical protein [Aurantiacibacter rhizosphaerae]MWV27857.1 hypothetical protein [Aurantiacibacter rhizosphaerae]
MATAACDEGQQATAQASTGGTMIDCSLNGAGGFGRDCTMELVEQDGADFVIVRHPDGAFRRFELGVPGRGLITAAGAQQAEVTPRGGYIEVRVSSDRYHLPVAE